MFLPGKMLQFKETASTAACIWFRCPYKWILKRQAEPQMFVFIRPRWRGVNVFMQTIYVASILMYNMFSHVHL